MSAQNKRQLILHTIYELYGNETLCAPQLITWEQLKSEDHLSEEKMTELLNKGVAERETHFSEEAPLTPEQRSVYETIDVVEIDGKTFIDLNRLREIGHCNDFPKSIPI